VLGGISYDYYIDATSGDDSNDGSKLAPWKTLGKIDNTLLVDNDTTKVLVKSGTYDTADDYIAITSTTTTGARLEITCESGAVWDGTAANVAAPIAGVNIGAAVTYVINGNGLTIQNYKRAGDTPNGIGTFGASVSYVYDVNTTGCADGFSAHDDSEMYLYRCTSVGDVRAIINVGTTYCEAYDCAFSLHSTETSGTGSDGARIKMYRCSITPTGDDERWFPRGIEHYNCVIGNTSKQVRLISSTVAQGLFVDCYVNMWWDGNSDISLLRCYGKISTRVRPTGTTTIDRCCIVGVVALGATNAIPRGTSDLSGSQRFIVRNTIFNGSYTMQNIDATNAAYIVAESSEFFNNCLFGGVVYDAELIAADTGNTVIVGTITSNPDLVGPANSTSQSDYAIAADSPLVGAGVGGVNVGFTLADIA
jgi:hypothetical protein